ncbi:sonic hedgehog protein isoform X2 [Tetranychus urticae]|uniref:sonic hedgehog protein isoform X2 n=1 Tax=Tetranychus urticae TaxID=32264 RepID=UPI000D659F88|nr:sonic hedgehog protein isoform X2 [Tetranychus urticae]
MTQFIIVKCFCAILLINTMTVSACGPGRSGGRRRIPRKTTPLVLEQHIPNVSENTLSASGPSEGKINETDSRFTKLVPNYNPDIVFKDEEGTGIDRIMTTRLKEKLDILASLVQNHWPGIKLRVIEAWDDGSQFNPDSLHYEGRAADITTSDKDNSKYGVLARLAVIAGFDWVLYESRYHVHVSVKSDKAALSRSEGCFTGDSLVYTRTGPVALSKVNVGQEILSLDSNGQFTYTTQRFMQSSKSSITLSQPKLETNQDDRLSLNNQINGTKYNEINVNSNNLNNGIHWYPKLLYTLAKYVISNDYMYS